jgi:hypothetical protein
VTQYRKAKINGSGNLTVDGLITVGSTVDGRDISADATTMLAKPTVTTFASTDPNAAPDKIGDFWIRTDNDRVWVATGSSGAGDYIEITGVGPAGLPALSDVSDATVNTTAGHVLRATGSAWVNAQLAASDMSGLGALATLANVSATEIQTNAVTTIKILDANVTLAKLANLTNTGSTGVFIGRRNGQGTGVPEEMTKAQAQTLLNVADGATNVAAASTTVSGHSELATTAEIDAGTDTVRTMVPDLFAASRYGTKDINFAVFGSATACAVGDGTTGVVVPAALNGMNVVEVVGSVHTAGTTGTMDIQVRRHRGATDADVLSTKATIDTTEHSTVTAATGYTVDTANDDLATGDMLFIDVDAIHTTPALGLSVVISARMP